MKNDKVKKQPKSPVDINRYIPSIELKKIPPEKAFAILKKTGYDINEEESEEIMQILYIIVQLTLKEFFTPS
ncbi:hypothetical protein [Chryseobacterium sp.]|uniref:hypothetical protein n=1 Tax=Chryseobacterium sp. TaxID=1871047 RepID=UPI0011C9E26B|nr:hypothetical protein [Chryseobacterium sp.]TXF78874.1 hypothetical protein FUA25_00305 [Chryseobacterium sp.]